MLLRLWDRTMLRSALDPGDCCSRSLERELGARMKGVEAQTALLCAWECDELAWGGK